MYQGLNSNGAVVLHTNNNHNDGTIWLRDSASRIPVSALM